MEALHWGLEMNYDASQYLLGLQVLNATRKMTFGAR
jgi:hypothetical protein